MWLCLKVTIWWFLIILPLGHNCHSPPSWDKAPYQDIYIHSPWNLQYIAIKFRHIDQHFLELDPIHATKKVTHESSIAGAVPHCQGGGGCQARPGKNMKQVRMVLWMNIISYFIISYHIMSVHTHICIYIYAKRHLCDLLYNVNIYKIDR